MAERKKKEKKKKEKWEKEGTIMFVRILHLIIMFFLSFRFYLNQFNFGVNLACSIYKVVFFSFTYFSSQIPLFLFLLFHMEKVNCESVTEWLSTQGYISNIFLGLSSYLFYKQAEKIGGWILRRHKCWVTPLIKIKDTTLFSFEI